MHWASSLAADLNGRLPPGWFAEPEARFGIEVDVGVVEDEPEPGSAPSANSAQEWVPGTPTLTLDVSLAAETVEVAVYNYSYSPSLVAAIELVSPANKDRPGTREAFVAKCETILAEGAGLIVVDIVTEKHFNLHAELLDRLGGHSNLNSHIYAVSYHAARSDRETHARLRIWEESLALGGPLPVLPLYLRVGPMLPVDLEAAYRQACQQLRVTSPESVRPSTT